LKVEYVIDFTAGLASVPVGTTEFSFVSEPTRQIILFDPTRFVNPTIYFEVAWSVVTATAEARLYNVTDGVPVAGSVLSGVSLGRVRSGALSLPATAKEYAIQLRNTDPERSATVYNARLIVVDDVPAPENWTKNEQQIEISNATRTNSTSYVDIARPIFWLFQGTDVFDGTLMVYFEVTMYCEKRKDVYARLIDNQNLVVAELVTNSPSPVRVRSGTIGLTMGREYRVQIASPSGAEMYLTGAKIILRQIGAPITKTQIIKKIDISWSHDSTSWKGSRGQILFDTANFNVNYDIYFEACLVSSGITNYSYARLYNDTDKVAVTNSEVSNWGTTLRRKRSGVIYLASPKEYIGQFRSDMLMVFMYVHNFYVIFNVYPVVIVPPKIVGDSLTWVIG